SCMILSASSSRWWGLTVHFDSEQPEKQARRAATRMILEKNRECTGVLLDSLGVVCVEDHVVPDVAAHRDPLLERHDQAAADVHHRIVASLALALVRLLSPERAPRRPAYEGRHRGRRKQVGVEAAARVDDVGLVADRLA